MRRARPAGPRRSIGLFGATAIGVAAIIGGGILALAGAAFSSAGRSATLAIALNGVIALITAMSFAELSTAFPRSGGAYVFANKVLSIRAAFGVGWVLWFAYIVACVLYALGLAAFAVLMLQELPAALGMPPPRWLASHGAMVLLLSVGISLAVYVPMLFFASTVGVPGGTSLEEFSNRHGDIVIAPAVRHYLGPIGFWLVIAVALGRVDHERKTPNAAVYATGCGVVLILFVLPDLEAAGAAASLIFLVSFALAHATAYLARKRASCAAPSIFEAIAVPAAGRIAIMWLGFGVILYFNASALVEVANALAPSTPCCLRGAPKPSAQTCERESARLRRSLPAAAGRHPAAETPEPAGRRRITADELRARRGHRIHPGRPTDVVALVKVEGRCARRLIAPYSISTSPPRRRRRRG